MRKPLYGNIIVQNRAGEILRAVESIARICDKIYVMDGNSTDGTFEVLKSFQKAYNLELHQHPYDRMDTQRNRLLELTPKNSWVLALDSDEQLNIAAQLEIRMTIDNLDPKVYEKEWRQFPISIGMPFYNLIQDLRHHTKSWDGIFGSKLFYYDEGVRWLKPYHCYPAYSDDADMKSEMLPVNPEWAIYHYACLNETRVTNARKNILSGNMDYKIDEWDLSKRDVTPLPADLLP